jgi:hypothetical protein
VTDDNTEQQAVGGEELSQRIADIFGLDHPHDDPSDDAWLLYTYNQYGEPVESANYTDAVFELEQLISRHYIAKEAVAAAIPKISYKHLRWCQTRYEEACTCGLSRRNDVIRDFHKALNLDSGTEGGR